MRMRTLFVFPILLLFAGVITAQSDRDGLRGIPAVKVTIQVLGDDGRLGQDQLRADIESRLRKAGIRVSDSDDAPLLQATVTCMHSPWKFPQNMQDRRGGGFDFYAFNTVLQLDRAATVGVGKDSRVVSGTVWSRANLGLQVTDLLSSVVRDALGGLTDIFANDFLVVNQK